MKALVQMLRLVLNDQERFWTSPFHASKRDIKYWAIFGGLIAALIAADRHAPKKGNPCWLVRLATSYSHLGAAYTLVLIGAAFYFRGIKTGEERFRKSGLVCFETLIDTVLVEWVLKLTLYRQRPLEGNCDGRFFRADHCNTSFPSGHTINTFGMASVFAHAYSDTWWAKILAYTYAVGVALARIAANRHFPSDTLAGGAMGWFIGASVYAKRHNPEVDRTRTAPSRPRLGTAVVIGAWPLPSASCPGHLPASPSPMRSIACHPER